MTKVSQFIRLMFESRQAAHKAHFLTTFDARHRALEKFYDDIVDLADKFTEVYIAKFGKPLDLDFSCQDEDAEEIISTLRRHLDWIETNRSLIVPSTYTPIQSLIDDIVRCYLHVLYRLENLM